MIYLRVKLLLLHTDIIIILHQSLSLAMAQIKPLQMVEVQETLLHCRRRRQYPGEAVACPLRQESLVAFLHQSSCFRRYQLQHFLKHLFCPGVTFVHPLLQCKHLKWCSLVTEGQSSFLVVVYTLCTCRVPTPPPPIHPPACGVPGIFILDVKSVSKPNNLSKHQAGLAEHAHHLLVPEALEIGKED